MVSHFKKFFLSLVFLGSAIIGITQNYHAMQGSSYAGSIGVGNNPSSIVNTPSPWDVNVLSTQLKYSNNAIKIYNYSLLSSVARSAYMIRSGNFDRYGTGNFNTNILNARIALDRKHAIAFGLNLRGYASIKTSPYNFIDTVKNLGDLMKINQDTRDFNMRFITSNWVEIFGTYGWTIWDREIDRLNGGITVKAMRGMTGAFANVKNLNQQIQTSGNSNVYALLSGEASYGYNVAYDKLQDQPDSREKLNDFVRHTEGGLSVDLGVEYLIKEQAVPNFYDDDGYYDYEWKIGLSLLDIGQNSYKYSSNSFQVSGIKPNVDAQMIDRKFNKLKTIGAFNDSLASITNSASALSGSYEIVNPARMVLNVDRYLGGDFYMNGDLSINLSRLAGKKKMYVEETNLLTLTPRWETRKLGAFLPIQYNTQNILWIGGALKAGPLLLGIHNWGNIFSKKKMHNGGGYFALIIRPGSMTGKARMRRYECPD